MLSFLNDFTHIKQRSHAAWYFFYEIFYTVLTTLFWRIQVTKLLYEKELIRNCTK